MILKKTSESLSKLKPSSVIGNDVGPPVTLKRNVVIDPDLILSPFLKTISTPSVVSVPVMLDEYGDDASINLSIDVSKPRWKYTSMYFCGISLVDMIGKTSVSHVVSRMVSRPIFDVSKAICSPKAGANPDPMTSTLVSVLLQGNVVWINIRAV